MASISFDIPDRIDVAFELGRISAYLRPDGEPSFRDALYFYGNIAQIRAFANAILHALPEPAVVAPADETRGLLSSLPPEESPPDPQPDPPYPDTERDEPWIDEAAAAIDRFHQQGVSVNAE